MDKRILIVDDERNVRLMYRSVLERTVPWTKPNPAPRPWTCSSPHHYDLAVLDLRMPEMTGLELLEKMNGLNVKTPVVIITAYRRCAECGQRDEAGRHRLSAEAAHPRPAADGGEGYPGAACAGGAAPEDPHDFDYYLRSAKRAINLRDFARRRSATS